MNKLFVVIASLVLTASACNAPNNDLVNCDFDQNAMLTNYADEIIIPRFENMETGVLLLEGAYNAFVANPTPGLLVEMRIAFGATYQSYQRVSPFGFGPGLINGEAFRVRFNTFPTNIAGIHTNIENGTPVTESGASTVGFPAIEYLLFGEHGTTDSELIEAFTTSAFAANRTAYLGQLVEEIKTTTLAINSGWDSYRNTFVANTGNAAGSSLSLLVNEFNFDYETLKNFKFKIPLGKFNGGIVMPETVEAYYAGGSMQLAQAQLSAAKNMFLGIGENGSNQLGLYDYVACAKPLTSQEQGTGVLALADEISEQFAVIEETLNQVPDPLSETLISNKPVVDDAYTQLQMMVPLIKHEMTSALSVQISYQDNDGD